MRRTFGSEAFLDLLPVGIYCCDGDGIIRYFNRRAAELWGRAPTLGDPTQRFCGAVRLFLPDGTPLPHAKTPMARVLRTGRPERDQRVVIERPDGAVVKALVNIDPLLDEDGRCIGAVNCFQDISELSRVHEELRKSRDDLQDFFENSAVALHVVDHNGTILQANAAELALLGYGADEYVGRNIADFHVDADVIDNLLARLQRGEAVQNYPARLRAKDGMIKHVLVTSSARFEDGRLVRTRCFTIDVTAARLAEERVVEGERLFYRVLDSLPAAVYTTDAAGKITFYNRAAVELAGREPQLGSDEWCVSWRLYRPDGSPLPHDQCPMAVAHRERRSLVGEEAIAERPDGSRVRFLAHPTPLFGRDGGLTGMVNMLLDITARHEAEFQSAHLAAIIASSDDAIVSKTLTGRIYSWNDGAKRLFGYEADEMIGEPITKIIPPELHPEEECILGRLQRGERIEPFETIRLAKDGRRIDVSLSVSPVRDKSGRIIGASKVARDITERKRAEELQRLLIDELNHRVKNTLATVQSIANQTVRLAPTPEEFAASFNDRLRALAHTHDVLTRNSWRGADILALVNDQLLLGTDADPRVSIAGPHVALSTQSALHLAMILHELGTNARKYGSLSVAAGRLTISWTVQPGPPRVLRLTWRESDGPAVVQPARTGFGAKLIEKSLATHGGRAQLHYRPTGLVCEIELPLLEPEEWHQALFAPRAQQQTAPARPTAGESWLGIKGRRVLVVEDEPLIALDISQIVTDAGGIAIGPATTVENGMQLIGSAKFDVCLLDANLSGKPVDAVAAELTRRGVPFAFVTGYGRDALPTGFRHVLVVNKPLTTDMILTTIERLLERSGALDPTA